RDCSKLHPKSYGPRAQAQSERLAPMPMETWRAATERAPLAPRNDSISSPSGISVSQPSGMIPASITSRGLSRHEHSSILRQEEILFVPLICECAHRNGAQCERLRDVRQHRVVHAQSTLSLLDSPRRLG